MISPRCPSTVLLQKQCCRRGGSSQIQVKQSTMTKRHKCQAHQHAIEVEDGSNTLELSEAVEQQQPGLGQVWALVLSVET